MRLFVQYNQAGDILSALKVETLPDGVEQPYSSLGEGQFVLEVPVTEELLALDGIQLISNYRVDPEKKQLVKKT